MYADDTVLVFADKNVTEIERILNQEMKNIADYCRQNELIINTKKGKTEIMLFGNAKRLHSSGRNLEVFYNGVKVNFVTEYKYLGIIVDNTLTMSINFDRSY